MIETTIFWAATVGLLLGTVLGLLSGVVLFYYIDYKPLRADYKGLVHTLTNMKKQGFVPQFEIENPKAYDPSEGVNES